MSAAIRATVRAAVASDRHFPASAARPSPSELYCRDVFSMKVMRERLPGAVYSRLESIVACGGTLLEGDADVVASAMKNWALERGAVSYTHWFQPMTGATAEKHDAFLVPAPGAQGQSITEFSGKMLIKGEPDASSFPSGGIRSTFEARGYTAWDPTSPAFLMDTSSGKTLYIPCIFLSYTGESLDRKLPLLRSLEAISAHALRILRLFGNTSATAVHAMVGAEQEYFLVDRRYYSLRTDLFLAGRTLFGAKPCKGQELEDHYFGSISPRVLAFMGEVEERMLALGIPARTRHNEVAPGQYELAPMHEEANIATDHNMLTMEILRVTAEKHGFACLLHEKPFAGINGSGKHNNWSLCDSEGNNLLDPGSTPLDNAQFLVFLAAVLRAMHKYPAVLRLGTAGAGNDHRLGANEAPPAILSVFLGEQLTRIIDSLALGEPRAKSKTPEAGFVEVGVSSLPKLPKDTSDRNRTSPFAFTGNKIEFRAVGASQSIAPANITLNAAIACSLDDIATELESSLSQGRSLQTAVQDLLSRLFKEHRPVVFNGNSYSEEWELEAAQRGLPNFKDSVTALSHYNDPEVMAVFLRHGVLSEREILARQEILLANYVKALHVETKLVQVLGRSVILPVCLNFAAKVAAFAATEQTAGVPAVGLDYYARVHAHIVDLMQALADLDAKHEQLDALEGIPAKAKAARDILLPLLALCRVHVDALEGLVDDADWPLPKYNEMLWQQ
ncbi:MAG: glutamine synthetase III [Deltaproteobacteria bacterium]|jgi:glutamine synthetase|nr:glutamine synthetase III [Deltaproteobacteria bacterium]